MFPFITVKIKGYQFIFTMFHDVHDDFFPNPDNGGDIKLTNGNIEPQTFCDAIDQEETNTRF